MTVILYKMIDIVTVIHNKLMSINDAFEYTFTDKELHLIVIGVLGMLLFLAIHPLFSWLSKKKLTVIISWFYVVTLLTVITFAIEIGQRATHTGTMEFRDILYGMMGFFLFFAIFEVVYQGVRFAVKRIRSRNDPEKGHVFTVRHVRLPSPSGENENDSQIA